MKLSPGTRLGQYEILSFVGAGGMGEVYRARDTRLRRDAALKVLPENAISDAERRARFDREARAVAALNHPNIVTIYGVEEIGAVAFLAMELVDGRPLADLIPVGGMPIARLLSLATQLADAVSAAHQQGITHRDLKPANVMVTGEGRVKVLDFGLARLKEDAVRSATTKVPLSPFTAEGRILGTVAYMSPEQAEGKVLDYRSDIFSFGIVLYEMATGQSPFKGDSSLSVLSAIIKDTPASVTDLNPALPRELSRMIKRCLAKDPEQRYQSAKDLRNDLDELKHEIDSGGVAAAASSVQAPAVVPTRATRRRLVLAASIVAVLALVAAGWLLWPRHAPAKTTSTKQAAAAPASAQFDPRHVAVARFENRTGDASLDQFGAMAQDYLTTGLSQMPGIETVSPMMPPMGSGAQVKSAASPGGDLARVLAEQTGAGTIVTGACYLVGGDVQLQARVVDARTGKMLVAIDPISGPRAAATMVLDMLRQRLMVAISAELSAPPTAASMRPSSPPLYEAYREYLTGRELFGSDYKEAIRHLERASGLDPNFFMPQFMTAVAYGNIGATDKAGAMVERLNQNRSRFGAFERLYIDWYRANLDGRMLDELSALRELEALGPRDRFVQYLIGGTLQEMNRAAGSVEVLKAFRPPGMPKWRAASVWPLNALTRCDHMLGNYGEELQVAREARVALPQAADPRVNEARALAALGHMEDLDRLIEETLTLPGAEQAAGDVMEEAVAELRIHGHREDALALAGKALAWHRNSTPQAARTERARFALGRALYQAGQWGEARVLFAKLALERSENLAYQLYLGTIAARLGDRKGAARISDAFERVQYKYLRGQPSYYRAQIAALLGDRQQAVALLQRAFAEGHPCDVSVHHDMNFESLRDYPPFQELLKPKG